MISNNLFVSGRPKPVCIGTGLVVLDVVINGNSQSPLVYTGGSCGNVLTILSYLGWESYPIARIGNDKAAAELLNDMEKWGVKTYLISQNSSDSTPIIIEKLEINQRGVPWHRFEWTCPNCGSWLPRFKPVLARDVEKIGTKIQRSQVFYFDRVARSSVELAKLNKSLGALIFFEPSAIGDEKLFTECLLVADIVKYSHERAGHIQEWIEGMNIPLEIETLGAGGLRYRRGSNKKWQIMPAYLVKDLRDAVGAGDWCSAGIIHLLGSNGRKSFENAGAKDIDTALSFGQALAALNCYYEGARGSMYSLSKRKFQTIIHNMWTGIDSLESVGERENNRVAQVSVYVCLSCINHK